MKSLITDEMLKEFNDIMISENSIFRLEWAGYQSVDIVYRDDEYLKDKTQVYPNRKFYEKLNKFFNSKGIFELSYNNTATTFWKIGD